MEIEDIAGIGLTSGGTLQDKRDLAIGHSLLGKVIIDDEGVASGVTEVLSDCHAGERSIISHRRRVGCVGSHNDCIWHRSVSLEGMYDRSHCRGLLSDCYIDAIYRLSLLVIFLLVDDGVDRDCGLAHLTVADDELALSAADWNHGVDSLDTGLQRLVHRLTEDHARSLALERKKNPLAVDRPFAVDRLAEHVDHTAQQTFAHRNGSNFSRASNRHVFRH